MARPDWKKWLRSTRPIGGLAIIDRHHIYILPTRHGWLFTLLLIAMLLGSINYSLSLGFVLTFLLAGLGIVAMLHTWRNLAHLSLASGRLQPVFAGQLAQWEILLDCTDGWPRYAIALDSSTPKSGRIYADIDARGRQCVTLPLEALRRGWLKPGRLTVSTEFPLGLFHAWSHVELDASTLVYPRPARASQPWPMTANPAADGRIPATNGDEDLSGLRAYQAGDSSRRIDWKASARGQGLLTREFHGMADSTLWLDWSQTTGDPELRLSQLTRWLLDARDAGLAYGLRLPQQEIAIGQGAAHERRCLAALAPSGELA